MSTTPKLMIVIATYNEIDNLPSLVERLLELLPDCEIVVVDDNSPDGTGKWCREQAGVNSQLHLIERPGKEGLGSATLTGIRFALENGFDYVGTMDADWSHDPQAMSEMWDRVVELRSSGKADSLGAVLGSRYVPGGRIDGWPWFRRFVSANVNRFTRLILGVTTRDNTGALRIYSASALVAAKGLEIKTQGYGYLEEMIYRLHLTKVDLVEHPITFVDRLQGKSKTSMMEGFRVLWNIICIRFR